MIARLLFSDNQFVLLLCPDTVTFISSQEAKRFLLNYSSTDYIGAECKWCSDDVSMEEYSGQTVAFVDNKKNLVVTDNELFRSIIGSLAAPLLSANEYAEKHGKQPAIVRRMCGNGRIPGALRKGNSWVIPADAPYPVDARVGRRV